MRAAALPFLTLLLISCTSQRKQLGTATAYEQGGMHQKAFDHFEGLYLRKGSTEAHLGMKRTAQHLFDRMQQEASGLYLADRLADGEHERQKAATYKQQMDRKGLELQWDPMVDTRRHDAQQKEATRLYDAAETAYRADRFAEAEELASQSLQLAPTRKETEYLHKLAYLEPLYRQGQRAMELDLWRDAFTTFKRVTDRDAGYKDTWTLQDKAREQAQVVIAYMPLFNRGIYNAPLSMTGPGALETQLAANIKQTILDLKDPLLVLVDRDNTDQLLAEQQRQMAGAFDDRYVVEAGKFIGVRYVLTAKILRYDEVLRRDIEVQMQLLDAESGRIHISELVRVNKQEIARGNTRAQLLERSAKRIATRIAAFDPHKR